MGVDEFGPDVAAVRSLYGAAMGWRSRGFSAPPGLSTLSDHETSLILDRMGDYDRLLALWGARIFHGAMMKATDDGAKAQADSRHVGLRPQGR